MADSLLLHALNSIDLKPIGMEYSTARAKQDVIDASIGYVQDGAAYIGVISHRYGQDPPHP